GNIEGLELTSDRDATLGLEAITSSGIPAWLRYFEKPEGNATLTLFFCELSRSARPEASSPRSRCSRPRTPSATGPRIPSKLLAPPSPIPAYCPTAWLRPENVLPPKSDVRTLAP